MKSDGRIHRERNEIRLKTKTKTKTTTDNSEIFLQKSAVDFSATQIDFSKEIIPKKNNISIH